MAKDFEFQFMSGISVQDYFRRGKNKKERLTKLQMVNMLRRTMRMFKWSGKAFEEGQVTQRHMELTIQTRGHIGVVMKDGKPYDCWGTMGDILNYEYMPTKYIITNPYLELPKQMFDIYGDSKDVVVIPNDSFYRGLIPILSFHGELLTEIQLTKKCILLFQRAPSALTAPDNNAKEDIKDYLNDLDEGEIGSIFDKYILKDIGAIELSANASHNIMTQVLEMEQYQKAAMFNDVGLQLNYNMKRESITSSEAQLGESALLPLPDDMMDMRKKACKELKETFDLDWDVEFDSSWRDLRKSISLEIKAEENTVLEQPSNQLDSEEKIEEPESTESEDKNEEETD